MTARAFKLLDKLGTRFQFGGTPELGCRVGLFTLKALLNARRNHDLASYVGFVDLVKAYDTANHDLLLRILERYGAPPKFVTAIQTIYTDNVCVLKIEKETVDKLDKTQNFPVADGFVSFTRTLRYLGLLISYNLRNDADITSRLAAANASMGRLKEVWRNPHLDVHNKYLLFCAIPMNLLLWGAETWSLRKLQLDKLEVFLHRSIRCILQISMTKVHEQRLHNDKVRQMFYSIPCVRNMIAARQMDFIGKMIRGPPDRPSRNMITACCNHKRRVGCPQTTGKTSWLRTSASFSGMYPQSRLTDMAPCETGFTKF